MGVSITWSLIKSEHDVTPGLRSYAAAILQHYGLIGALNGADIPNLRKAAMEQEGSSTDTKFDPEFVNMCQRLIAAIERHGTILVALNY